MTTLWTLWPLLLATCRQRDWVCDQLWPICCNCFLLFHFFLHCLSCWCCCCCTLRYNLKDFSDLIHPCRAIMSFCHYVRGTERSSQQFITSPASWVSKAPTSMAGSQWVFGAQMGLLLSELFSTHKRAAVRWKANEHAVYTRQRRSTLEVLHKKQITPP